MNVNIDFSAMAEDFISLHPASNLYFLLDQSGLPGFYRQMTRSSLEWISLFADTKEEKALIVAPVLVAVCRAGHIQATPSLLEWIGQYGTFTSTVIALQSSLQIKELHGRLVARLAVILSEDVRAMLRFFDPRVLQSLANVLSKQQVSEFFSPAEEWRYVDRSGKLVVMETTFAVVENMSDPLKLTQQQESNLLETAEVDQILTLLSENFPVLISALPVQERFAYISREVTEARGEGINSVLQLATIVANALLENKNL